MQVFILSSRHLGIDASLFLHVCLIYLCDDHQVGSSPVTSPLYRQVTTRELGALPGLLTWTQQCESLHQLDVLAPTSSHIVNPSQWPRDAMKPHDPRNVGQVRWSKGVN